MMKERREAGRESVLRLNPPQMYVNLNHVNSNALGSVVVNSVESVLTFDISDVGPKFDWPRELTVRERNLP